MADLAPLSGLTGLRDLDLAGTGVADLAPLTSLTGLTALYLAGTAVADLAPLSGLTGLTRLDIRRTGVSDLKDLARSITLSDAAVSSQSRERGFLDAGLEYADTPIARTTPFATLSQLDQPARTVETINYLRRQEGLEDYLPEGYERPDGIEEIFAAAAQQRDEDENERDSEPNFKQRPANYSFFLKDGKIEAEPQAARPKNLDLTKDIYGEVLRKAAAAVDRLARSNVSGRVRETLQRLQKTLGNSLSDLRPGLLKMCYRSLEADFAAYNTPDGRRELAEDAFAVLQDIVTSIGDLVACYPDLADLEAESSELSLQDSDVPQVIKQLRAIQDTAAASDVVAPSSVTALSAGDQDIAVTEEIIATHESEIVRKQASKQRRRLVGQKLLDVRNFLSIALRGAQKELSEFAGETWKGIRKEAPKAIAKGVIKGLEEGSRGLTKVGLVVLVSVITSPIAVLAFLIEDFAPFGRESERINAETKELKEEQPSKKPEQNDDDDDSIEV